MAVACVVLSLSAYSQPPSDTDAVLQQEKNDVQQSPAAKFFPAGLFEKVEALQVKLKETRDNHQLQLLQQQARWLLPEPQISLPAHVSRIMGTLKFKHDTYPVAVLFAPDGKSLYTSSSDGTVRQWNLQNGRTLKTWEIGKPVGPMALSNNGQYLAVGEGYRQTPNMDASSLNAQEEYAIHVIDLSTGKVKWKSQGIQVAILCLAFSSDDKLLTAGTLQGKSDPIQVWNVASGKLEKTFKSLHAILNTAWSRDGSKLFVTTSDRSFGTYDTSTGMQMQSIREKGMIYSMALSPDEKTLAIAGDTVDESNALCIKLYDTSDWKVTSTLAGNANSIISLAFQANGQNLVSSSAKPEATIKVWNLAQKTATSQYLGHLNDVTSVAISPADKSIASASLDGSMRLWFPTQVKPPETIFAGKAPVWSVACAAKLLLTTSADHHAVVLDSETGKEISRYREHEAPVTAGCIRQDGQLVATGGADKTIRLWEPATGKTVTMLSGHNGVITTLVFSNDGKRLFSASADKTVRAWNLESKQQIFSKEQHRSVVTSLALNADGSLLASGGADNIIRIWRAHDGSELRSLIGHTAAITGLAFSPGGTLLASVGADGLTKIWEPATRNDALRTLAGHVGQLMAVAFSPDLQYLATAGADETIRIWNLMSFTESRALKGHTSWVSSLTFSPDGDSLFSASVDGTVRRWRESKAFEPVRYGHEQAIRFMSISPNGDRLISASDDGRLILWDTATGNELAQWKGHASPVQQLAFSLDGKRFISMDKDLSLKLWNLASLQEVQSLSLKLDGITRAAFLNADQGVAIASGASTIGMWTLENGTFKPEPQTTFTGHERHCNAVGFAREKVALGGMDGNVKLWNLKDFKQGSDDSLRCYPVAVHELALSADGKQMFTTSQENEFKLWNLENKQLIHSWVGRSAKLTALALHPGGNRIITSFDNGEVVFWDGVTGKELRAWKFKGLITDLQLLTKAPHAYAATANGVIYQLDLPQ
ncbi:MAG: hypothetical protein JNJ77_09555 [Planctomycetia bacterium]|nr:hypothetical protein [Planctomycetia bacterium]